MEKKSDFLSFVILVCGVLLEANFSCREFADCFVLLNIDSERPKVTYMSFWRQHKEGGSDECSDNCRCSIILATSLLDEGDAHSQHFSLFFCHYLKLHSQFSDFVILSMILLY